MTQPEKRYGAMLASLREDLPSARDEARIRSKLTQAGVAVGAAAATTAGVTTAGHNLAHAAATAGTKLATTSAVPAAVPLGGATAVGGASALGSASGLGSASALGSGVASTGKSAAFVAGAWASASASTKAAVVGLALAGGSYPVVSHITSSHHTPPTALSARLPEAAPPSDVPAQGKSPNGPLTHTQATPSTPAPSATAPAPATESPSNLAPDRAQTTAINDGSTLPHRGTNIAPADDTKRTSTTGASVTSASVTSASVTSASVTDVTMRMPPSRSVTQVDHLQLREETLLIERALIALRSDDKAAAARWLGEHERRFPSGVLVKERQRLQSTLR